ncbi:MAG: hypothetical protein JOY59_10390, partial [Candidatus Eremiobacteraeota bacterium]|nr:hypothetical protein [Candidatus Eremiobacteraeota bacterium]
MHPNLRRLFLILLAAAMSVEQASAAGSSYTPPLARLAGMHRLSSVDAAARLHVAVELAPKDSSLERLALSVGDPASPDFHHFLSQEAFVSRFGRSPAEAEAIAALLRSNGARDVYVSSNHLVVGGDLSIHDAERAFHTIYATYEAGARVAVAPTSALMLPVAGVRDVRGAVTGFAPRLAQVNTGAPSDFRGAWYTPKRFAELYEPLDGAGARVTLIEDSADQADPADLDAFLKAPDAIPGASVANVHSSVAVEKTVGGAA